MERVYWQGREPKTDPRMAGVTIVPGGAVDVPGELARALLSEDPRWSREPSDDFVEIAPEKALEPGEREWAEIAPSETDMSLERLTGIGPVTAAKFETEGISNLSELAALSDGAVAGIAERHGLGEGWLRHKRNQAKGLLA